MRARRWLVIGVVAGAVALGACSSDEQTPSSTVPASNDTPSTAVRVSVTVAAATTVDDGAATVAPTIGAINGPAVVDMTTTP